MRNLTSLIELILPPNNHTHRNGFSNEEIIKSLSKEEKLIVETELIKRLSESDDNLIGESLVYLKSIKSIPSLKYKIEKAKDSYGKIFWMSCSFQIKKDNKIPKLALQFFLQIRDKNKLITLFHILANFHDKQINEHIKSYINDSSFLVAYNARKSIRIETDSLIKKNNNV